MPDYRLATRRAARKYGVDPSLLEALINQESGFNPHAKSPAGAQGIAQFMPGTAPGYGVNLHDNRVTDDLEGAAKYIAGNLKRTGGNVREALSIYNSGRPQGYKTIPETRNYVAKILAGTRNASSGSGDAPSSGSYGKQRTRTVGGVDNSALRGQAIAQFLGSKSADPLDFALQVRSLQDVPGRQVTTTSPSSPSGDQAGGVSGKRSPLRELFWQGQGGIDVKNGQKVPQGFVSGHQDHVHVAAGPKTVVELGQLAQSMGLHVGENPHFGGVNPVHVKNSYHYRNGGEAIDVSGDPAKMRAFAKRVARLYGIR